MNINVTELAPCRKKVEIEVSAERVREEFDKNYNELAEGVSVPGFRPGKVPRAVLRRRYQERVSEQVKAALLQEVFTKMLDEHDLDPVAEPDLELDQLTVKEDQAFELSMELEVKPDFDLGEYKGIEVDGVKLELDESEIERSIEVLQRQRAEMVPIDGEQIGDGDHVISDFKLTAGEEEALNEENIPLRIKAGEKIPTFEIPYDDFIGKKVEDTVSGTCTLPDNFQNEALQGKEASYELTIRAHQRLELPELDEAFCNEFGCDDESALRDRVRHNLEHNLEHEAEAQVEEKLLDILLERTEFEIPDAILKAERERVQHMEELEMRREGLPEDEIHEKLTAAQGEREEVVRLKVRRGLIIDKIAKLEGEALEVSEDEVEERIKSLAQSNQMWPNQMRQRLEKSGAIDQLTNQIATQKVRAFLRENAKINQPTEATPAEQTKG